MVPSHNSAEVSLMLREANGTAYSLDFGRPLHGPPGGLQPMQLVVVVGVLDAGERADRPHGPIDRVVRAGSLWCLRLALQHRLPVSPRRNRVARLQCVRTDVD